MRIFCHPLFDIHVTCTVNELHQIAAGIGYQLRHDVLQICLATFPDQSQIIISVPAYKTVVQGGPQAVRARLEYAGRAVLEY
jgi:hypothetical protein